MPYMLRSNHPACGGYAVVNSRTGNLVPGGCHPTKKKAVAHLRALYRNVGDASAQDLALTVALATGESADTLASRLTDGLAAAAAREAGTDWRTIAGP
jgi:hypothetical protein